MRFLSIFTALAITTTTVGAQPKQEDTALRVSYVAPKRAPKPLSDSQWIELASPTSVRNGTEFIIVGAEAGRFSQLRVEASSGTVILLRVQVLGSDGAIQTVRIGRSLDRTHRSAVVDLVATKAIDQIAITTESSTDGKYTVSGSTHASIAGR